MRAKFVMIATLILISACAEKTVDQLTYSERKELAGKFIQNCKEQGLSIESPEMVDCFNIEAARETKRREDSVQRAQDIGMAISAGAKEFGDGYGRAASSYQRPINCTSNRIGNYTNTRCY